MRLATIKSAERAKEIAVIVTDKGLLPVEVLNDLGMNFAATLFEIIERGQLEDLKTWWNAEGRNYLSKFVDRLIPHQEANYAPLYRHPRKIWGIGLNYVEHAYDLNEKAPSTEPASFMKPDTTIIGPGDTIQIPVQSERTTAEAELGVIIGKQCKGIQEDEAEKYIAGYTTVLDMTAEDILQVNPRYLTRAKSFDTFFSFGPHFVTPDEIDDLFNLSVATYINGQLHRTNKVCNMTFNPYYLVAFHSQVMTLLPGDIISTGTPGAVVIRDGDVVECRIDGFEPLVNSVKDLKRERKKETV